uniref:Uncharacterized protein MANES_03G132900 n=1 Tax=Rhizophora mucronata TaxID=61149 RepID=A0A2P2L1M2_RHIMU
MSIFNGANIYGNHTWRIFRVNGSIWEELSFTILTCFKLEENLFLPNFSEVKFLLIKGLQDLINTKFSWSFLQVAAFIQLSNETILARNHLGLTSSDIIAKESLLHPIFPLPKKKRVKEGNRRLATSMSGNILIASTGNFLESIQRKPCTLNAALLEAIAAATPTTAATLFHLLPLVV